MLKLLLPDKDGFPIFRCILMSEIAFNHTSLINYIFDHDLEQVRKALLDNGWWHLGAVITGLGICFLYVGLLALLRQWGLFTEKGYENLKKASIHQENIDATEHIETLRVRVKSLDDEISSKAHNRDELKQELKGLNAEKESIERQILELKNKALPYISQGLPALTKSQLDKLLSSNILTESQLNSLKAADKSRDLPELEEAVKLEYQRGREKAYYNPKEI